MPDAKDFEDGLIAEMRANGGQVTSGPLAGHPLLVMTCTGARSGRLRRSILTWHREGDDFIVAGTAGGAPVDPAWVKNIEVNPDVTIEQGNATFPARASIVDDPERIDLWRRHIEALPWFAAYPDQAGRDIPMIRIRPTR